MGIKNAEFDADFESVEKVAKKRMRKKLPNKKRDRKKWKCLLLLLCVKVFGLQLFCGFVHFSQQIRT
jgi:hypothetical protein